MLGDFYRDCSVDVTWYTLERDAFLGPKSAERIVEGMDKTRSKEDVNVSEATHPGSYMRRMIWEGIYAKITGSNARRREGG